MTQQKKSGNSRTQSIQIAIEKCMARFGNEDRWECIQLYSSDGLLMAGHGFSKVYNYDNLLEFSFSLIETINLVDSKIPVKEIVVRGTEHRRLVFRFFTAWDETCILAAVIQGRKGYSRAMTELIKLIQNIT